MAFSGIALIALAAAQAAQPGSGVHWTPLTPNPPAQSATTTTIAPSAPQAVILSAPAESVLRAGTEVPLRMLETVNSNNKSLREGARIRLEVAQSVQLGGNVVIPAGSQATAEVTEVRRKGMWGKSGRIEARVLNVRVGDRLIRLSGTFDDKGVTGTAGVVTSIALVPLAGFFVTGTSANIPAGSGVKAFLDEDLRVAVAPVAPAPVPATIVTPAAAPAPASAQ
jgi:hypothetical protein